MEMHTLLSSALENSSKNTEKLNSLKSKLFDSENLIITLTQKVKKNLFKFLISKYYVLLYLFFIFIFFFFFFFFFLSKKYRILTKLQN
jgi:predicted PurR-regulated permease PerM